MKMPNADITVSEIARIIGDRPVEVMNASSQESMPGWTLFQWANYFETPPTERKQLLNVISLEISDTELAKQIQRPSIVRQLDWIDQVWNFRFAAIILP
jgi:F-box/leucine-rich repeat protein 10/11